MQDLLQRGYQYWALGHCHEYEVLSSNPPIIFPGNLQGRSIRECGPKGAVIVEVEDGQVSSFTRLPLAKIQWALISADLSEAATETEAFEAIRREIQKEVSLAGVDAGCVPNDPLGFNPAPSDAACGTRKSCRRGSGCRGSLLGCNLAGIGKSPDFRASDHFCWAGLPACCDRFEDDAGFFARVPRSTHRGSRCD